MILQMLAQSARAQSTRESPHEHDMQESFVEHQPLKTVCHIVVLGTSIHLHGAFCHVAVLSIPVGATNLICTSINLHRRFTTWRYSAPLKVPRASHARTFTVEAFCHDLDINMAKSWLASCLVPTSRTTRYGQQNPPRQGGPKLRPNDQKAKKSTSQGWLSTGHISFLAIEHRHNSRAWCLQIRSFCCFSIPISDPPISHIRHLCRDQPIVVDNLISTFPLHLPANDKMIPIHHDHTTEGRIPNHLLASSVLIRQVKRPE